MEAIETIREGGLIATLHYDQDCMSPRDCDGNFLFVGFPHRSYSIGDEELDPGSIEENCTECRNGYVLDSHDRDTEEICPACQGASTISPHSLNELMAFVQRKFEARVIRPVGMIDHSGVSYYLGGGAHWCDPGGWDSGTCGFIMETPETMKVSGRAADIPEETIVEWMGNEINEYSSWASGDCYGYHIERDPDQEPSALELAEWRHAVVTGETTHSLAFWLGERFSEDGVEDSCWGFIGYDYAMTEMRAALDRALGKVPAT